MASEIGAMAAPPTPWPTRKAMSHSMLGARPQASEERVKTASPTEKHALLAELVAEMRPIERKRTASARL